MITIFSDYITKRLLYTLELIFDDRGIDFKVVNDPDEFIRAAMPKLVYSTYPFDENILVLEPAELLFEENIRNYEVDQTDWSGTPCLSLDGQLDPLASIFFVVSMYEEYCSDIRDEHDRFPASESLLYRFGWLDSLIVERWSEKLIDRIENYYDCSLDRQKIDFQVIPTFDIDNTFAYKLKEGWRKWLSISRDLIRLDRHRLHERSQVLRGIKQDPYDTFNYMLSLVDKGYEVHLFWLLGNYSVYDRNISFDHPGHQEIIAEMTRSLKVGLHPSYRSNDSPDILKEEKDRLESIADQSIIETRQHFLKLILPLTYERLEKKGFTDDYSLGFADHTGFRAGIARPFNWYNLKRDQVSGLRLHPFAYMDGTLNEYMQLDIDEACRKVQSLRREVEKYGGDFIMIWHNETIGEQGIWKGWRSVLECGL
ncbi:MAG: polysaccharide deacetylase family protein [Bacteroidota bacterium]